MTSTTLNITLNGRARSAVVPDDTEPLLFALRGRLDQLGPKFGCGVSQCGSCTVLVNGAEIRSCVVQVKAIAQGAEVSTLDGLAQRAERSGNLRPGAAPAVAGLHPLQQAFITEQAGQCAFCMNGMIMGSLAWMNRRLAAGNRAIPTEAEIRQFLSGKGDSVNVYLCRCGAHGRIVRAIQRAAGEMV
jgi:aerobic-type carbon monoxide dehydrogenase small subunit (CoxS/CutS family)